MEPNDKLHSEAQEEPKNSEMSSTEKVDETLLANEKIEETTANVEEVNQETETVVESKAVEETVVEPLAEQEAVAETDVVEEEKVIPVEDQEADAVIEETKEEASEASEGEGVVVDETPAVEEKKEKPVVESKPEVAEEEIVDYDKLNDVELVNALRDALEGDDFLKLTHNVESIKIAFYKKNKNRIEAEKKAFIENGGAEDEFKVEQNPYEQDIRTLLNVYRGKRQEHSKELEGEKESNLARKYEIIDEIKNLVNRKESINKTFNEFRDLQTQWREIGLVPQAKMKDLWENYHHHVENFYDYIKINKELRDLDLKKNQEHKITLCEKTEALLMEPSVIKAFNTLQKFHDQWREIGPVPRDKKEELWERFKAATTLINKKHQEFFENRKKAQKKNLEAKTALCEKVEEILGAEIPNHKDWEEKSKEIIELQKYWRTIGFAPKKDNNSIYERFRNACDAFFDKKRAFYSNHKEVQNNNLQLKIDLCVQAETLKDSTDWKKTTDEFISIQRRWKEIGPVPRKHSDSIWKRFRAACDFFFEQKAEFFETKDEVQVDNLKAKNELIEKVEKYTPLGEDDLDFKQLKEFQREWSEIGHVPIRDKNDVQKRFRDAINEQFDKLRIDDKERNLLKFKNKVSELNSTSRGNNKLWAEREKYINKLKQLENDLVTLKNNIGFFAQSKNAEALIKDVNRKIERNEEQITYLKDKIRIINESEND